MNIPNTRSLNLYWRRHAAIDAIAGMCGYRSDIALKWIFHKRMGVSMKEWRSRNRHA